MVCPIPFAGEWLSRRRLIGVRRDGRKLALPADRRPESPVAAPTVTDVDAEPALPHHVHRVDHSGHATGADRGRARRHGGRRRSSSMQSSSDGASAATSAPSTPGSASTRWLQRPRSGHATPDSAPTAEIIPAPVDQTAPGGVPGWSTPRSSSGTITAACAWSASRPVRTKI